MAEIYWPAGVPEDPLRDSLQWEPVESGAYAVIRPGQVRAAPRDTGFSVNMSAQFPMSRYQFNGIFLPWWRSRKTFGGCDNGVTAFWLRDPLEKIPYRWIRQEGQAMQPVRDGGVGFVVALSLWRLPT